MIEIDFFKRYNDTYGHQRGDDCLRMVAKALDDSLSRAEDFVARYGGEEFIVVLPNAQENGACMIAQKLLDNVMGCKITHKLNEAMDIVTISVGVTTGYVKHTQTADNYIKRADEALYLSKQSGRNKYTFLHRPDMEQE